ncbi:MAG TPA: ATPase, T2SS/T4P/T4SS family [Candidatus Rifleibacterium sp.]|nr:ATPase, T2SS/T4P/T4SS family [Candidatus Rifleibacterium sp.]HPT44326.1 ATPase, T2SS/T4P/T4SS family [Candidatus Rifleibacterium sp.]
MDQAAFKLSFPAFPTDSESLEKLGRLLINENIVTSQFWEETRQKYIDPVAFVAAIAASDKITPDVLANSEASILNIPFIKLDEIQISQDAFKLLDIKLIKEKRIIPIKINGPELVVGTVAPADTALLVGAHATLSLKPAKVLGDSLDTKIAQLAGEKTGNKGGKGQKKRLGDILVESKYCTAEQLDKALKGAKEEKLRMGAYLVKHGILSNKQLSIALSKQYNIPFIDLDESLVDPVLATLLPKKLCHEQILCPVKRENNKLVLAMTDPTDIITIDHIEMMTGMRVSPVVSSELSIIAALGNLYGENIDALADGIGGVQGSGGDDQAELGGMDENDAPIIKLVNLILTQAVVTNVSDIHIEIYENELRIRFRQDGTMKVFMTPAKAAHAGVISRIKVMASLDIAETRRPQDGRIKLNMQNRKIDLRVSCIPCVWGEKVVMRICDQGNLKVDLKDLGFEPFVLEKYMEGVESANGIVLVTGPTGSGKTTTLYSSLFLLNNPSINIMTAEDPVEYNLMGINQVQCHADIGLDFNAALRSFLRQDPDVIMLGEIRDFETANIAIKAALTGHLVISTLHTNDAPATVARLLNMGIEPFSLASSLRIVQAQRLVKKVCKTCGVEFKPDKDLLQSLGITERLLHKLHLDDRYTMDNVMFKRGSGCPDCDNTGLKGRQGIYEVLSMTQKFRELIESRATTEDMRRQALIDGMLSLRESAIYKLICGSTSVEEVFGTTIDAGGQSEEDGGTPKPKMAEASAPAKPVAGKPVELNLPIGSAGGNLGDLSRELHEFNSLLARVSGATHGTTGMTTISNEILKSNIAAPLEAIRAQAAKTDQADKALPIIMAQGQKMEHNVKNLISHFSDYTPKLGVLHLNQLVEQEIFAGLKNHVITARLLSGVKEIGKNLKVSKNLPENLPDVKIDAEAFATIASNIFINALIGLGSKGGEIKVVTRIKPKTTDRVEFIIFDSGSGIPVERQGDLFKPFVANGKTSLGLGLAVAQKLVRQLNGEITIRSTPDTSTLVTVELPAAG